MARFIRHVSVNIEGLLRNYKRKSLSKFFEDENGRKLSDAEARQYLTECQAKGWKKIPCNADCEGFDYFDKGCPGHEIKEDGKK
jgi:hypothetical protein